MSQPHDVVVLVGSLRSGSLNRRVALPVDPALQDVFANGSSATLISAVTPTLMAGLGIGEGELGLLTDATVARPWKLRQ